MPENKPEKSREDYQHPQYKDYLKQWQRVRDAIKGEDAVKDRGEKYLPKLDGMQADGYNGYKDRAWFYGATERTVTGLHGAVFRKEGLVELPGRLAEMEDNIDNCGTDIHTFAKNLVKELLSVNRFGLLLDLPEEATAASLPFISAYPTESIWDWRYGMVNGEKKLVFLVLHEESDEPGDDGFGHVKNDSLLVFKLLDDGVNFERWAWNKDAGKFLQVGETRVLQRVGNEPMREIAFRFVSSEDFEANIRPSHLVDLVNVNLSHYRTTADLEHGAHYTALPTPVVTGATQEELPELILGPQSGIRIPNAEGQAFMLEYQGQGLGALEKLLDRKEALMVQLGARLLEPQKRAAETEDTVRLRHSGENSILANVVGSASRAIYDMLVIAAEWTSTTYTDETLQLQLNMDFFDNPISPEELREMIAGWLSGAYSYDTLHKNLKKREFVTGERDAEEELGQIKDEGGPGGLGMYDDGQSDDEPDPQQEPEPEVDDRAA